MLTGKRSDIIFINWEIFNSSPQRRNIPVYPYYFLEENHLSHRDWAIYCLRMSDGSLYCSGVFYTPETFTGPLVEGMEIFIDREQYDAQLRALKGESNLAEVVHTTDEDSSGYVIFSDEPNDTFYSDLNFGDRTLIIEGNKFNFTVLT